MTDQRLRTYEKLLEIILIIAVIAGLISSLTGCAYTEVDTKIIVDYRFTPFHEEEKVGYKREYDFWAGEWYDVPYKYMEYVPEKYELLWECTYMDGHKEKCWEECTRFEYQNAKEELGGG